MLSLFGIDVEFDREFDANGWLYVLMRLSEAIKFSWQLAPSSVDLSDEIAAIDRHHADMAELVTSPPSIEESNSSLIQLPLLYFSPYFHEPVYHFPTRWCSRSDAFRDGKRWKNCVSIHATDRIRFIDEEENEDVAFLKAKGLWGHRPRPPEFSTLPFRSDAQKGTFEDIYLIFEEHKSANIQDEISEIYWQFNIRVFCFVCSAVWDTYPVRSMKVVTPDQCN